MTNVVAIGLNQSANLAIIFLYCKYFPINLESQIEIRA